MPKKYEINLAHVALEELPKLLVQVGTLFIDEKGIPRIQCLMSNNSIWVCDPDGTNWWPAVLPIPELTARFHKEVTQKLKIVDKPD